jgi:UrcA family protein
MKLRLMLASLALTCTTAPALAAQQDRVSVEVGVEDLDLSTARDQNRLDTRINSAAQKVCRSGVGGTAARMIETSCVKAALANAKPQVEVAIASSRGQVRIAAAHPGYGG